MKNIIIAGSARSGKTTLASMIKERFPKYSLFHGDCIREWLIAIYGIPRTNVIVHSDKYAEAMVLLANTILKDLACYYIIEWSRLFPTAVEKLSECARCHTIYLGHGGIDAKALMKQCRANESVNSFTSALSDTALLEACERWAATDLRIMNECAQLGLPYYDTSTNRMDVLQSLTMSIQE